MQQLLALVGAGWDPALVLAHAPSFFFLFPSLLLLFCLKKTQNTRTYSAELNLGFLGKG